jgi:7-cyano-7-deazaguanine tRNA-ribosyltransferase
LSFEIRYTDLAARIGVLDTPHGLVETPTFVPVVHPVRQSISPSYLKSLGFHVLITNAYIALRHYGNEATEKGIHSILNYDGTVMTDSGGYQVLEYGSIRVEPQQIAQFQKSIKSDIAIPLDKPTGYGLKHEKAKKYVEETLKNAKETLTLMSQHRTRRTADDDHTDETMWLAPIQGGEHSDLVSYSADSLVKMGFNIFGLGSPVELMEAYEFSILAQMIYTVKNSIPAKPIHLFGAGHPITIPLAVALGCDMFDSASYMLYAKDNRYMHANGTMRLEELSYFPCCCSICSDYTVGEMLDLDIEKKTIELAKHNLNVLKAEVCAVKEAIMQGRLWEYVMQKARAHPKLFDAIQLFKNYDFLDEGTPLFKEKAIFLFDAIDQYRPEVRRFRKLVSNFRSKNKKKLILYPESHIHPFYCTKEYSELLKKFPDAQICTYNPYLGVIPSEICDIYPASHNLTAKSVSKYQTEDYHMFIDSLTEFLRANQFEQIIIIADIFMHKILDRKDNMIIRDLNPQILDHKYYIPSKL